MSDSGTFQACKICKSETKEQNPDCRDNIGMTGGGSICLTKDRAIIVLLHKIATKEETT